MLIAFDGICLGDGPVTGVGRAFLTALAAYAARGDAECVLLLPGNAAPTGLAGVREVAAPRGAWRRQFALPRLLRSLRADVLHSSVAAVPLRADCPTIATVHDLPWCHPELQERDSAWRRLATARSLRAAHAILVPSSLTRDDVAAIAPTAAARVHLVPHATALGAAPTDVATDARRGAFVALGDDRPRKNRARLAAAHARAQQQDATLPALQFVGPPHAYVDEAHKQQLLAGCRALVHVSCFEGFGLPVLEGLAAGAPVLCSDLPPHREIAGEHACFVDARDEAAIAAGLSRLHRDRELRQRLASGGHARAAAFAPATTAQHWARVHREVAR